MGARLLISYLDGRRVDDELAYPFDQFRVVIGRSAATDIRLPHRTVSDRHATIEQSAGTYRLTDHGSTNGTRVNGRALVTHRGRKLQDGDRLEIGVYELTFHDNVLVTAPLSSEHSAELARRLMRAQPEAAHAEPPRLVVVNGPQSGTSLHLRPAPEKFTIGSASENALVLGGTGVEAQHAELLWTQTGVELTCPGTDTYVTVGGRRMREFTCRDGEEITLGQTVLFYEEPAETLLTTLDGTEDEAYTYSDAPRPTESGKAGAQSHKSTGKKTEPPTASQQTSAQAPHDDSGDENGTDTGAKNKPAAQVPQTATPAEEPPAPSPAWAADLLVFGLAGVMLTVSIAALIFLLRAS